MTDEQLDNLIGTTIEVFLNPDEVESEIKEVVVKSWKRVADSFVIITEEGEVYADDEINWRYSITPEAGLWLALVDNDILPEDCADFDFEKYHKAFSRFMEILESLEIVKKKED